MSQRHWDIRVTQWRVVFIVYHLKGVPGCRDRAIFHGILGSLIVSLTLTISFSESFARSHSWWKCVRRERAGRCFPNAFCVSCRYRRRRTYTLIHIYPWGRRTALTNATCRSRTVIYDYRVRICHYLRLSSITGGCSTTIQLSTRPYLESDGHIVLNNLAPRLLPRTQN